MLTVPLTVVAPQGFLPHMQVTLANEEQDISCDLGTIYSRSQTFEMSIPYPLAQVISVQKFARVTIPGAPEPGIVHTYATLKI